MSKNKLILIAAILLIFSGLAILLFFNGIIRFNYPSSKAYPVRGIDISHHQGIIDWNKVQNENISFAFIKATEGISFVDSNYHRNITQSRKYINYFRHIIFT